MTNTAPRDKWQRLLNARRLSGFEAPDEWQQAKKHSATARRQRKRQPPAAQREQVSGSAIKLARKQHNLTQRALADQIGKSQSWIRDIEKGRFGANAEDQALLQRALNI